jgi:hypothetical protein
LVARNSAIRVRTCPRTALLGIAILCAIATLCSRAWCESYTALDLFPVGVVGGIAADAGQVVGQGGNLHATLWTGPAGTAIDLNPAPRNTFVFVSSVAYYTSGAQQVGYAKDGNYGSLHAFLWNGTAYSAVDLGYPAVLGLFGITEAYGTDGTHQVGAGYRPPDSPHALLWSGSQESAVDLHPAGFDGSEAVGVSGNHQVGNGTIGDVHHALLWGGTASSAIDLHPTDLNGFIHSFAVATTDSQQVGFGSKDPFGDYSRYTHALVWSGTAESAVDLQPTNLSGVDVSVANGTNGAHQVGVGYQGRDYGGTITPISGTGRALLWSGTADSVIDLQSLLPADFTSSTANTIDTEGNVFGTAFDSAGMQHAVEWVPVAVAEPAGALLSTAGFMSLALSWFVADIPFLRSAPPRASARTSRGW